MTSSTHLVEIDLLRAGRRMHVEGVLPVCDYVVHVSRVNQRPHGTVRPLLLHHRLPVIPVPLSNGDPDATFDLQLALSRACDNAAYRVVVDYDGDPPPPPLTDAAS